MIFMASDEVLSSCLGGPYAPPMTGRPSTVEELLARMAALLTPLEAAGDEKRHFHSTYRRTTIAVEAEIRRGGFVDGPWVERWDVVFAGLYLDALEQWNASRTAPEPWPVAFQAAED